MTVRVPSLDLIQAALEFLVGPPVSLSRETSIKWLKSVKRNRKLAPPKLTSLWCPSNVLESIPDAEREMMRVDSAKNFELLKELGPSIPTFIVASDNAEGLTTK